MAAYQYVYHMDNVSKTYPGGKKCFENINLNFLPGVKIGVVGVNGSGKSTLLQASWRAWIPISKARPGQPRAPRWATLAQEPHLDPSLDVKRQRHAGCAPKQTAILERYNELAMNYSDETADEMAALQDQIDAGNLWELDSLGWRGDGRALRCPPDDADVSNPSLAANVAASRCANCLLEAPDMLLLDEPTNHLDAESIAWLQKHLIAYKGTILDRHP